MTPSPNQERCCEKCYCQTTKIHILCPGKKHEKKAHSPYWKSCCLEHACPCHTQNHSTCECPEPNIYPWPTPICSKCGLPSPQNHSIEKKLVDGIEKARMELVDAINTPQNHSTTTMTEREMLAAINQAIDHSTMEGWEDLDKEFESLYEFGYSEARGGPYFDGDDKPRGPNMETATWIKKEDARIVHEKMKDRIRTLAKERESAERRVLAIVEEASLRHTTAEEREDSSPYALGVMDGHRCARTTLLKVLEAARKDTDV